MRLLGLAIVPTVTDRLAQLVVVIGGLVLLWGAANLVVSLATATALGLLLMRLYKHTGPTSVPSAPVTSPRGSSTPGPRGRLTARQLLGGLTIAALGAAAVGGALLHGVGIEDHATVMAHRGASAAAPENTLAAVERAIRDGADWVEIDVQETLDGEVVVLHDSDLMKVAGVDAKIWDLPYAELRAIDVGSHFAAEFRDQRVPRLEEVLRLCKDRIGVNIELKYYGHDQRLEERVIEIVEATGMSSDVVIMSLKHDAIATVRRLRPDWRVGLLTAVTLGDLTRMDVDFLAVHTRLATAAFVRTAHRRGKDVYACTVNDKVSMSRMISRGVDALITDEPARARDLLAERTGLSAVERLLVELALWFGVQPTEADVEAETR